MGLQVVVPPAQPGEVVEAGGPSVCHRLDVVDLELAADVTARRHTGPVTHLYGRAQAGRDGAPEVADRLYVGCVGEQRGQVGVCGPGPGGRSRIGPIPGTSQLSPSSTHPLVSAPWSTTTCTVALGP